MEIPTMSSGSNQELSPLEKLMQGEEQKIEIPLKTVLVKAMRSLNSPSDPVFKCVVEGHSLYKVWVEIDVSRCRYYASVNESVASLCGDQCVTPELAEESVAKKAFEYLACYRKVYILDHSCKVADEERHLWSCLFSKQCTRAVP